MQAVGKLHPGLSIDCVIFGFDENQLKVLLLKFKEINLWALPGGFIGRAEGLDEAASHILKNRTGLDQIFLTQFHVFGDIDRVPDSHVRDMAEHSTIPKEMAEFINQRFITVGYYSLVNYFKVIPQPDEFSEACSWCSLDKMPKLMIDHADIVNRALLTLRTQLKYQPIGLNLLPEKFTMPELQTLYETLLGIKLDRRNFQRKMMGYDILIKLDERRKGGAHKAPFLYKFDKQKYQKALEDGLTSIW